MGINKKSLKILNEKVVRNVASSITEVRSSSLVNGSFRCLSFWFSKYNKSENVGRILIGIFRLVRIYVDHQTMVNIPVLVFLFLNIVLVFWTG